MKHKKPPSSSPHPRWKIRDSELMGAHDRSGRHNYREYLEAHGMMPKAGMEDSAMYDEVLEGRRPKPKTKK